MAQLAARSTVTQQVHREVHGSNPCRGVCTRHRLKRELAILFDGCCGVLRRAGRLAGRAELCGLVGWYLDTRLTI